MPITSDMIETLPPGRHHDGNGLYLQVRTGLTDRTNRSWLLRYTLNGKAREMGLGPYPKVTLKAARDAAKRTWGQIKGERVDPVEARRAEEAANRIAHSKACTFKQVAFEYIAAHEKEWTNAKHAWQWGRSLELYAFPLIGD